MDRDDTLFNAGQYYGSAGLSGPLAQPMTEREMAKTTEDYLRAFPEVAARAVLDATDEEAAK